MIIATRLSAVWQVAGVAAAALCCYLVSQSVAAERASLEKVDRQIADTRDDIAKLQTEIGVRARMGQLESWNRNVLALQAPRPSQFVASGLQLAALYGRHGQPALQLDPAIASQQGSPMIAAYQPAAPAQAKTQPAPAAPMPVAPTPQITSTQPMLRTAAYVRPAPDRLGGDASATAAPSAPAVQKASLEVVKPAIEDASKAKPKPEAKLKADAKLKAGAPVKLAHADPVRSLLPADISQLAAREAHGVRDNNKAAR